MLIIYSLYSCVKRVHEKILPGGQDFSSRAVHITAGAGFALPRYHRTVSAMVWRRSRGIHPSQLEYYYAFVSAGCIGLLEKWLSDGMTASPEQIAKTAVEIMLKGIGFLF